MVEVRTTSHRSSFSRIIERDPPILSVSKVLCLRHVMREIFVRKIVHFDTNFFISIMFELGCTKLRIFQEAIVDPFEMLLDAPLFQIMGLMIFFLFWSFPISVAMRSSLLNYVLWNSEKVQCIFNETSMGRNFFQEVPACAIDDAFTPEKIGILCTASWGLSRTIQTALRCPCSESFSWTSY